MTKKRVLIMGAAGRDFHDFNVYFRGNEEYEVVCFTATQIPDIDGRKYPKELAGSPYNDGIPIYAEDELERLIAEEKIDIVDGVDFQAPLYYLQMRRALGLIPDLPVPPCVVHLTGSTERRARLAGEESCAPAHLVNKRHEDLSIPCADFLLSQDDALAEETRERYALDMDIVGLLPMVSPEEGWPAAAALPFYERVAARQEGSSLRLPRSLAGTAAAPESHGGPAF